MDIKTYTNENYIPISELSSLGDAFVTKTLDYRRKFMEIIPLDNFEFVNIVETPQLIKKRYAKNVEIKDLVDIEVKDYDYILEIAKKIVLKEVIPWLDKKNADALNEKYKENNNDLTIITNWLVLNIKEILNYGTNKMIFDMPELSKNNINFIQTFNKEKQSYSINDYIKLVKCSYETGRKSLEKLVKLDLYRKNKLGKKFVYKPTKKLKNILKGGEYGN